MGIGVAARFRSKRGRCFLIGDAAHQMTPAGGFGMNTGIQDAHNLVWKIAAALRWKRTGDPETVARLLASYEAERQPVARQNADLSLQNFRTTLRVPGAIGLPLRVANRLCRLTDRLVLPRKVKRALFNAAMRLGLKQVDWLRTDTVLARRRRRALGSIFADAKRQTLQLLFPGQDLGFVYKKGWMAARLPYAADRFDPVVFRPKLILGGRMPHFWLLDHRGRRISTLDLPSEMTAEDKSPCYVMLSAGNGQQALPLIDDPLCRQFHPLAIARISPHNAPVDRDQFSFDRCRPSFLPRAFSALVRPYGHIAWLHVPDSSG